MECNSLTTPTHCPLCVDSMIRPKDDKRDPAIIFLDLDGVMIRDRQSPIFSKVIWATRTKLYPDKKQPSNYEWLIATAKHLHSGCVKNLDTLIRRVENSGRRALVVLSSAFRNDATLKQHREEVFIHHNFCSSLCGKAAPLYNDVDWTPECKEDEGRFTNHAKKEYQLGLKDRGDVVEYWLRDHGFDPEKSNYVVLDDYDDGLKRFGDRFVEVNPNHLFNEAALEKATKVLVPE